jgi:hypothetical protein
LPIRTGEVEPYLQRRSHSRDVRQWSWNNSTYGPYRNRRFSQVRFRREAIRRAHGDPNDELEPVLMVTHDEHRSITKVTRAHPRRTVDWVDAFESQRAACFLCLPSIPSGRESTI